MASKQQATTTRASGSSSSSNSTQSSGTSPAPGAIGMALQSGNAAMNDFVGTDQQSNMPDGSELVEGSSVATEASASVQHLEITTGSAVDTVGAHVPTVDPAQVGVLRGEASMSAFTAAAQAISAEWRAEQEAGKTTETAAGDTAASPATDASTSATDPLKQLQRAHRFGEAVNDTLSPDVYTPVHVAAMDINPSGAFYRRSWMIELQAKQLTGDPASVAEIANTAYHEARHAEQWHLMARMKAGENEALPIRKGRAPLIADLSLEMGMYEPAIEHAVDRPLEMDDPMFAQVQAFWADAYGAGLAAARASDRMMDLAFRFSELTGTAANFVGFPGNEALVETVTNLSNRWHVFFTRWFSNPVAYTEALEEFEAVKTELAELRTEMDTLSLSFTEAYAQYRNRSYEEDAFAAGDEIEARINRESR